MVGRRRARAVHRWQLRPRSEPRRSGRGIPAGAAGRAEWTGRPPRSGGPRRPGASRGPRGTGPRRRRGREAGGELVLVHMVHELDDRRTPSWRTAARRTGCRSGSRRRRRSARGGVARAARAGIDAELAARPDGPGFRRAPRTLAARAAAVSQVTWAPAATQRRPTWCMYCSAPPAWGWRTSRQFSTSDAADDAQRLASRRSRGGTRPGRAAAAARPRKRGQPVAERTRTSTRPGRLHSTGSSTICAPPALQLPEQLDVEGEARGPAGDQRRHERGPVEELEAALGVVHPVRRVCGGDRAERGAAEPPGGGLVPHELSTRGACRNPTTAAAPASRCSITAERVSTGVARSASKKPTKARPAAQECPPDGSPLPGPARSRRVFHRHPVVGVAVLKLRTTSAVSSELPLSTTTTREDQGCSRRKSTVRSQRLRQARTPR